MTLEEQFTPGQLLRLLLEWVLGLMGVLGSMLCLSTAFDIPLPPLLYSLVVVGMMVFCFAFRLRQGNLFGSVVGAALLLTILLLRRKLIGSFATLWNLIAEFYAQGYENVARFKPTEASPDLILILAAVLETYFMALALSWCRALPAALAMMLGVAPCYVLRDTPPDLIPLLLAVFSLLIQVLSQNVRRRERREGCRAILWSAAAAAAILTVLLLLIPPREDFRPPLTWRQLSERFENWTQKRNNRGNYSAGLSGNPGDLDLDGLERLPNSSMNVMEVTSDWEGLLYLRGSSYSRFDGRVWTREDVSFPLSVSFPSVGLPEAGAYQVTIRPIEEKDVCYTVYEPVRLPVGAALYGDAYFRRTDDGETYSVAFRPTLPPLRREDPAYGAYVRQVCLELSETEREALLRWWAEAGERRDGTPEELAERVVERVSAAAVYSREPNPMPKDRIFSIWFLTEAENGYCVHYASTAAALMRALGVPARYVSGYLCDSVPGRTRTVTTMQAHAWVEYYDAGVWRILEATPGDATEFTGHLSGETDPPPSTAKAPEPPSTAPAVTEPVTEPVTETPSEPTETAAVPTRTPDTSEARDTEPGIGPEETSRPEPEEPEETDAAAQTDAPAPRRGFPRWLWYPLGVIALAGLILLRRFLADRLRKRRLARAEGNERALLQFRRYRRLRRLTGEAPEPEAEALAKKACFSQHTLTPEEQAALTACLDRQIDRMAHAGFWKGLWYRYGLAVI